MKLSFNDEIDMTLDDTDTSSAKAAPVVGSDKTGAQDAANGAAGDAGKLQTVDPGNQAIAVPVACDDLQGEIGGEDLILPRINLTQKVGDLGDQFGPGVIVFQKEQVLWKEGDKPLNVVVLHAAKRYQENTEFGSDEMGQVVDTLDEVKALGGWIEWRDGADGRREAPPWAPRLDVVCLIEAPDGAETALFPFDLDGKAYAAAVWTLSKSAFTSAGRAILTARATHLRNGYRTGKWQVSAAKRQGPKGAYFVPVFRASGKTDDVMQAFAASVYQA